MNHFQDRGLHDRNPLELFDEHLTKDLERWIDMGDAIVLGIDMNEDAQTGFLSHKLKLLG